MDLFLFGLTMSTIEEYRSQLLINIDNEGLYSGFAFIAIRVAE